MPPVLGGAAAMAVMPSNSQQPHHHHHAHATMQPSSSSPASSSSNSAAAAAAHHHLAHLSHHGHHPASSGQPGSAAAAATVLYQPYNLHPSAPPPTAASMHHHQHVAAYHHATLLQHHAQQQQQRQIAEHRHIAEAQHRYAATLQAAAAAGAGQPNANAIERREAEVRELESREREAKIERERIEKQRAAEQAVHKHFEESFRLAQQKQQRSMQAAAANSMAWNSFMPLAPPPGSAAAAAAAAAARLHHHPGAPPPTRDEREREQQQQQQQQQQQHQLERSQQEAANEYAAQQSLAYLRAAVPQSAQQVSRPSSVPSKVDYPPPPAHSRTSKSTSSSSSSSSSIRHDKQSVPTSQQSQVVHQLPKAEPNVSLFGYAGYSPSSSAFSTKTSSSPSSSVSSRQSVEQQQQQHLPNPPPLLSDHKSSVIVKNEGSRDSHGKQQVAAPAHSPSPKMMSYLQPVAVSGSQHKSPYECRSPTQSPHHTSRPGSAHLPPTHHRHSPHQTQASSTSSSTSSPLSQQQQPPPEPRYLSRPEPQMAYPPPHQAKSPYPGYPHHHPSASPTSHYAAPASSKPKVSSPAPSHIYGKPNSGIMTGTPVCRASVEPASTTSSTTTVAPLPLTSKANVNSSFQPVVGHHQSATGAPYLPPPPAHSSRSPYDSRAGYNSPASKLPPPPPSLHSAPGIGKLPPPLHLLPPNAAGLPPRSMPGIPHPGVHHQQVPGPTTQHQHQQQSAASVQTQPLDLGVERSGSPKRKPGEPVALEVAKKRRLDEVMSQQPPVATIQNSAVASPQLSRVSEPSPLIASAATSITTVVNPSLSLQPNSQSQVNVPSVSPAPRTASGDGSLRPSSAGGTAAPSASPAPSSAPSPVPTSAPVTPAKADSPAPVRPPSSTSYPVHKLKKAWLQRHSGEDGTEDTTGIVGSGSCVTLPLNIANNKQTNGSADKDKTSTNTTNSSTSSTNSSTSSTTTTTTTSLPSAVNSIHNIGSMAVNSISKTKVPIKQRKTPVKEPINNGHTQSQAVSESNHEDSSNSEPERKAPPKRKAPKVKRKKGAAGKAAWTGQQQAAAQQQEQRSRSTKKTKQPRAAVSESSNESEEVGSDSNSEQRFPTRPMASPGNGNKKVPKKRGRKPRTAKDVKVKEEEEEEEEDYQPRQKKKRLEAKAAAGGGGGVGNNNKNNKKRRNSRISTMEDKPEEDKLMKTGQSWIQDEICMKYSSTKISKCRECRLTPNQRDKMSVKSSVSVFCRFYAFRRMQFTKNGTLSLAGFNDPFIDADENDIQLWLPGKDNRLIKRDKYTEETQKDSKKDWDKGDFDIELAHQIVSQVGDQFCDLIHQEKKVVEDHLAKVGKDSEEQTMIWKRVVKGVREMCDLCDTTLFNYHWTCGKCGFVVCIDCYEARKKNTAICTENSKGKDKYAWLMCANRQTHVPEQLLLTQIIPADCLIQIDKKLHECRSEWGISNYCDCKFPNDVACNKLLSDMIKGEVTVMNGNAQQEIKQEKQIKKESPSGKSSESRANGEDKLSWLADVALNEGKNDSDSDSNSEDGDGNHSTLRELLIRPSQKNNGSAPNSPDDGSAGADGAASASKGGKKDQIEALREVMSDVIERNVKKEEDTGHESKVPSELKHFVRRYKWTQRGRGPLPFRIFTLTESEFMFPEVPHSWLCKGRLLRLHDPNHPKNYRIFQEMWKRGQPVLVSDVHKHLDKDLWHPDSFAKDFGDQKNDLVNCMTGNLVPRQPMWKFWKGFENTSERLKDDAGNPMLLKLKDWPSRGDFADILPSRFADLMKCVPLSEYTHRYGRLNLTSRLPDTFTRPDLGPKMYNAYGSALYPNKGTTNLHLDVSDAVNVMVYVGISKDGNQEQHVEEAIEAIEDADCDPLTKRRVKEGGAIPGALWHIYAATDADKIRDMLNAVALERGVRLEPHHDPIHDQSFYLDKSLRARLLSDYNVEGYAIVQCLGDAVFVPAGAPHQVRNLHNCIKVAEDFVSPENISHCFHLTQEFRALSDTHTNHEDKLQIKNIIYHAVKDSLTALDSAKEETLAKSSKTT